jgi:hypothetical protein
VPAPTRRLGDRVKGLRVIPRELHPPPFRSLDFLNGGSAEALAYKCSGSPPVSENYSLREPYA